MNLLAAEAFRIELKKQIFKEAISMNEKIKAIWDKICAGASRAGEFATKTAENAGEKAKDVVNTSKINLKIFDLTTDIDILYKEVGKLIYAAHTNEESSTEELEARLLTIDEKMREIEDLKACLENRKNEKVCENCGKRNDADSIYCAACGERLD